MTSPRGHHPKSPTTLPWPPTALGWPRPRQTPPGPRRPLVGQGAHATRRGVLLHGSRWRLARGDCIGGDGRPDRACCASCAVFPPHTRVLQSSHKQKAPMERPRLASGVPRLGHGASPVMRDPLQVTSGEAIVMFSALKAAFGGSPAAHPRGKAPVCCFSAACALCTGRLLAVVRADGLRRSGLWRVTRAAAL